MIFKKKKAGTFSIQMDTTQDKDMSIVTSYILNVLQTLHNMSSIYSHFRVFTLEKS